MKASSQDDTISSWSRRIQKGSKFEVLKSQQNLHQVIYLIETIPMTNITSIWLCITKLFSSKIWHKHKKLYTNKTHRIQVWHQHRKLYISGTHRVPHRTSTYCLVASSLLILNCSVYFVVESIPLCTRYQVYRDYESCPCKTLYLMNESSV